MRAFGIDRFADRLLADCTLATQQRTEIARAVARDAQVFLFDEPNSALTDEESDELFREMRKLAAEGRIVVLVTHRLGDLVAHASRVAVIRDGRVRAMLEGEALSEDRLAQQLVVDSGADAAVRTGSTAASSSDALLNLADWSSSEAFEPVDLSAPPGQILALIGVEGSGARELLRSLAGLEECSGRLEIAGQTGASAQRLSAYVPASRQFSLYSNFSVGDNLLVRLGKPEIAGFGLALKMRRMARLAEDAVRRFAVKTSTLSQGIRSLSGGNQQKVAIAQALVRQPRLLLLGGADPRRRHPEQTGNLSAAARLCRGWQCGDHVRNRSSRSVRSGGLRPRGRRRPPFAADLGSRLRSRRKPRDGHHANAAASSRSL